MNQFLIDKEFALRYERHFCDVIRDNWYCMHNLDMFAPEVFLNNVNGNDFGVDIILTADNMKKHLIDVKCYRKPKFIKSFSGVFIETYLPKSGRPGWFLDEDKDTTHYIFAIDCCEDTVAYSKAWYISKDDLEYAVRQGDRLGLLTYKSISTAVGFILPYELLEEVGVEIKC